MSIEQILPLIEANDPEQDEIYLSQYEIDKLSVRACKRLGKAIGNNTQLIDLKIGWAGSTPANKIAGLCKGLQSNRSIRMMRFCPRHFLDFDVLESITSFVKHNPNLTKLDIVHLTYRGDDDIIYDDELAALENVLEASSESLKSLAYSYSSQCPLLQRGSDMLSEMHNLEELLLSTMCEGDNEVQSDEVFYYDEHEWPTLHEKSIAPIVNLLKRPESKLRVLKFDWDHKIDRVALGHLFRALRDNTQLKYLQIQWNEENHMFDRVLELLRLYNHTLEKVDVIATEPDPEELDYLLSLNSQSDKKSIRIRKSLDYDYLIPERPVLQKPFEESFDVRLLPYVLSSIGSVRHERDHRTVDFRISALHYFVCHRPMLVVNREHATVVNARNKTRKRKCH